MYVVHCHLCKKNEGKVHINKQIHMHWVDCFWERKLVVGVGIRGGRECFQSLSRKDLGSFNGYEIQYELSRVT